MRQRLSLSATPRRRALQQVAQQLREVEARFEQGHQSQAETLPKIAEQHHALIALLEGPEIREGTAWLR